MTTRELKYRPKEEDLTTFSFGGFELTFKQPSIAILRDLSKYAQELNSENLNPEEFPIEAIDEFIDIYVSLFHPQEYSKEDFKTFLEELPPEAFEELSDLLREEVFEKHQKKLPPGSVNSSTSLKEI